MVAAKLNETAIAIIEQVLQDPLVIAVKDRQNEVKAIQEAVFQKGVHYGPPYKGAKNDTLLKPGATFLQQKFELREQHERMETTIHVDPADLSKSYIIIQDRCRIYNSDGVEVAQADAACTTFEDKYVFRGGGDRTCPTCNEPKIIKSKFGPGWYCLACKAKFAEDDELIVNQDTTKKLNPNPLNLLDTIVAMAQKRASVRATIKATGVDALFSPGDGVTVDYYDDMGDDLEKAEGEVIQLIEKNALPTSQNAQISDEKATPSDLQQNNDTTPTTSEKGAVDRLNNGNGHKTVTGGNGRWYFDRNALLSALSTWAQGTPYQERSNTVKKMYDEGLFAECADLNEAVQLVIAHLNSHKEAS